jgi:hypothetical protein
VRVPELEAPADFKIIMEEDGAGKFDYEEGVSTSFDRQHCLDNIIKITNSFKK